MPGIVQLFGHSAGGRPSERLMARLGMPVGHTTILRSVKKSARAHGGLASVRVAGIDDSAWKKGMNYGTVIVDLEHRQVVGLLADRSAVSTAEWLMGHPEIKVVRALSHLASKGSLAVLDWFANPLTLLKPTPANG
jgi:hypothetical protein